MDKILETNQNSGATSPANNYKSLESIIKSRSTQRKFSRTHIPTRKNLELIIEAGIYAAFPALGTNRKNNPRQFIVLKNGTPGWVELKSTMTKLNKKVYKLTQKQTLLRLINRLTPKISRVSNDILKECEKYARMMAQFRGDFAHFETAPFWIIIAEHRHMPFILTKLARQSMGHCLQNIWLRATELGMIVQPVSFVYQLQTHKRICRMLGLQGRNWEMDSFLVGFPDKGLKPTRRNFNLGKDIIWHVNEDDSE
jgi:hypothetical protein